MRHHDRTPRPFAVALAAALAAVACPLGDAAAQDTAPVLRELQFSTGTRTTRAPNGAVLVALGRNLHQCKDDKCRHDEVEVKIGSASCTVLSSTFDAIVFSVPNYDCPPGKKKVTVSIRGRGRAELDLEVVDPTKWQNEDVAQREKAAETGELGGAEARAPGVEEAIRDGFKITRFELKRDAAGSRFEVDAITGKLPDGLTLNVVLTFNDREIEPFKARVQDKQIRVTFGPYTQQLLSGNYSVNLLFELGKQPRVVARNFVRGLKPEEAQVYDRIHRREYLTHGTDDDVKQQRAALQAHYKGLCEDGVRLIDEVERAFASGSRQFFRDPTKGSVNEDEFSAWVQRMSLATTAEALAKVKNDYRFSTRGGHFRPDEYKTWATDTLVPGLQGLFQKHRDFRQGYIASLDPKADMLGDYLVSVIFELFKEYTRVLYERAKIEVPEELRATPVDPIAAPTISRKFFDAQRRLLLRTVGLGNLVGDPQPGEEVPGKQ